VKAIDLIGRVFGRLRVVARAGSTNRTPRRPLWRCRCACGQESIVLAAYLLVGRTRSCGCLRAERARETVAVARAALSSAPTRDQLAATAADRPRRRRPAHRQTPR
jgi:hypothetical protein